MRASLAQGELELLSLRSPSVSLAARVRCRRRVLECAGGVRGGKCGPGSRSSRAWAPIPEARRVRTCHAAASTGGAPERRPERRGSATACVTVLRRTSARGTAAFSIAGVCTCAMCSGRGASWGTTISSLLLVRGYCVLVLYRGATALTGWLPIFFHAGPCRQCFRYNANCTCSSSGGQQTEPQSAPPGTAGMRARQAGAPARASGTAADAGDGAAHAGGAAGAGGGAPTGGAGPAQAPVQTPRERVSAMWNAVR